METVLALWWRWRWEWWMRRGRVVKMLNGEGTFFERGGIDYLEAWRRRFWN